MMVYKPGAVEGYQWALLVDAHDHRNIPQAAR